MYTLSLDSNFAPFLAEDATWGKKTKAQPLRGFTDDGEDIPTAKRQKTQQKVNFLELMLGQIANYCPVVGNLYVDVLAGTPFMEANDIAVHPAKRQVILGDGSIYSYGSQHLAAVGTAARRALVFRSPPTPTTVWTGEFVEVELPSDAPPDSEYALELRTDVPSVRKLTASQL